MGLYKRFSLVVSASVCIAALNGCSSIVKDHGLDYQDSQAATKKLEMPQGSHVPNDKLQIPNESKIDSYTATGEFEAPRAPFVYSQMAQIDILEKESVVILDVPAPVTTTKRLIQNYLNALYGEEGIAESQADNVISTLPHTLKATGKLKRIWSKITRLPLEEVIWRYRVMDAPLTGQTQLEVSIRFKKGDEYSDWQSPVGDDATHEQVIEFWRSLAQNLDTGSVILSKRENKTLEKDAIWSALNGNLAFYLGVENVQLAQIKDRVDRNPLLYSDLRDAQLFISVVPSDQVARVGDVVPLTSPLPGHAEEVKWFNVRRKDLDDVTWQEREYPVKLIRQASGILLEIDTSAAEYPLLISYRLLSLLSKN
ncbi:hypothetical protein [Marinomonas balearica]|uniref:Uncharacterized protein n=1 Tax=Marinomonas balearica TaxID=491947 RepID=A0A4R6M697_9GAMM|nr:hypothetical protein [Marinomonas balearica]TDO96901.1 hypothetical protein DFP79_2670 [Marinomonas balearica]